MTRTPPLPFPVSLPPRLDPRSPRLDTWLPPTLPTGSSPASTADDAPDTERMPEGYLPESSATG
jgi:hypothetical protein